MGWLSWRAALPKRAQSGWLGPQGAVSQEEVQCETHCILRLSLQGHIAKHFGPA